MNKINIITIYIGCSRHYILYYEYFIHHLIPINRNQLYNYYIYNSINNLRYLIRCMHIR